MNEIEKRDRALNEARKRFHKLQANALAGVEEMLQLLPKCSLNPVVSSQGDLLEAIMLIRKVGYQIRLPK